MWQKNGVLSVWVVALVVAAAAPLLVRLASDRVERAVRERTEPVAAEVARSAKKRAGRERQEDA